MSLAENVDFSAIESGWIPTKTGDAIFFLKIAKDDWMSVKISNIEDNSVKEKLNYVTSKVGATSINLQYIETLAKEFGVGISRYNDSKILQIINDSGLAHEILAERPQGDYISDGDNVIVNKVKYPVGTTVTFGDYEYVVAIGENGAYLANPDEPKEGDSPIVKRDEKEHPFNYGSNNSNFTSLESSAWSNIINPQISMDGTNLELQTGGTITRKLVATKSTTYRYWECFHFHPGGATVNKVEDVVTYGWSGFKKLGSKSEGGGGGGSVAGKMECFKYYSNTEKTYKYRHYTELVNGILSAPYSHRRAIYHQGGGQFKVYKFKRSLQASGVGKYFAKHPDYPYYTKSALEYLHQEYGSGSEVIDISNTVELKKYGLVQCPAGVYGKGIPNVSPGSGEKTETIRTFTTTSSTFHVDINYETLLRFGSDTVSRGDVEFYLYKGNSLIDKITHVSENGNKYVTKTYENMDVGSYRVVMKLTDTYQDNKEIYVKARTRIRENKVVVSNTGVKDDSHFVFTAMDSKGQKVLIDGVYDWVVHCDTLCRKCIRIEVPKGETYTLTGKFIKSPKVTAGGLYGNGASIKLNEGIVKYDIVYRRWPIGRHVGGGIGGTIGKIPPGVNIPGWEIGDIEIEHPPSDLPPTGLLEPFCWVDLIAIDSMMQPEIDQGEIDRIVDKYTCYPLGTEVNYYIVGMDQTEFLSINNLEQGRLYEDYILTEFYNPTEEDIKVTVSFNVEDNYEFCGGGGSIRYFGGGFRFWGYGDLIGGDVNDVFSELEVTFTEHVPNHLTVGGKNGSYGEVIIRSGGNIVESYRVDEDERVVVPIDNLFKYGDLDYEVEFITHQKGNADDHGYDTRSTFLLEDFQLLVRYELVQSNFDSQLDFYINNDLKFTANQLGSGEEYFNVKKGLNRYKFVFSTFYWDYNWDYVEIPWIRLTNWMCGERVVTPYCSEGAGDKCVEALIGCLLGVLPARGCITIYHYDADTGELLKKTTQYGYKQGYHTIKAPIYDEFTVVGESTRTIYVNDSHICTPVKFYYRKTYRNCVYVYHMDCETDTVLRREEFRNLKPGYHYFKPIQYKDYEIKKDYIEIDPEEEFNDTYEGRVECIEYFINQKSYHKHYTEHIGRGIRFRSKRAVVHFAGKDSFIEYQYDIDITHFHNLIGSKFGVSAAYYTRNQCEYLRGLYNPVVKELTFEEVKLKYPEIFYECPKGLMPKGGFWAENTLEPIECYPIRLCYDYVGNPDGKDPYLDCVIIVYRDQNGEVIGTDYRYNLKPGIIEIEAIEFEGYKVVGDSLKTIEARVITDPTECQVVEFDYEPKKVGCIIVKFIDRVNKEVLDTDYYYGLYPDEYTFKAKEFDGYELVSDEEVTILLEEQDMGEECKEVKFLYEPLNKGCSVGKIIWLFT